MTEAKYKNNYILWGALCAAYCAFIFVFSYLYPYGGDEYALTAPTFGDAIAIFLTSYLVRNPRIGLLFNNVILWAGKWMFLRLWTYFGAVVAMLSFVYAAWIILKVFMYGKDVPGYASLAVLI